MVHELNIEGKGDVGRVFIPVGTKVYQWIDNEWVHVGYIDQTFYVDTDKFVYGS